MRSCQMCNTPYEGGRRLYCSSGCAREANARHARERYRARAGLPPTWEKKTTILGPQRREKRFRTATCENCSVVFSTLVDDPNRFCGRICANRWAGKARATHPEMDSAAAAYNLRWQTAPGLGYARQKDLLVKWKRQRRSCAYCSEPATTLDHIVPLSRGGTNWEGNLAPSCRPCNSSKNNWFVREWRLRQLTSVL